MRIASDEPQRFTAQHPHGGRCATATTEVTRIASDEPRRFTAQVVLLALLALFALTPAAPARAESTPAAVEAQLLDMINATRAQQGLAALRVDQRLVDSARRWSAQIAGEGTLRHDPGLSAAVPAGCTSWGEAVGTTASGDPATALHDAFIASPPHRAILLSTVFSDVGIGAAPGHGSMWTTLRFTAGAPAPVPAPVPAPAPVSTATDETLALARRIFGSGGASRVVLVRDDDFPDALAAGPLARGQGPVLLHPAGSTLLPTVRDTLRDVLPRGATVFIVGGPVAVDPGIEAALRSEGWSVRRVAGADRVETAAAVARAIAKRDGRPAMALLSTGDDWPDAAAGGAFGARSGAPILLSDPDHLSEATRAVLRDLDDPEVVALGGPAALSDAAVSAAGATRVSGETREETALAVARSLWGRTTAGAAPAWTAVPSGGTDGWAWALTIAPVAARQNAAPLLVGESVNPAVHAYLAGLGYAGAPHATVTAHGPVAPAALAELTALVD